MEIKYLLEEVQGFLSSSCKESRNLVPIFNAIEQLTQCFEASDLVIETKHSDYIANGDLPIEVEIKEESKSEMDNDIPRNNKRKYNLSGKYAKKRDSKVYAPKRRRPNFKDMPPDMKLTEQEENEIVDSRRRRYCPVCTKGFGNQKRLDTHLVNALCNSPTIKTL